MTASPMDALRKNIRVASAKSTSTFNLPGTGRHVAFCVDDQSLRAALLSCTNRNPCNMTCCPVCARMRGNRYYNQSLKPAVAALTDPSKLLWITINVCRSTDMQTGNALFVGREHAALKWLVEDINDQPIPTERLRVWGAREIEPKLLSDGSVEWLFHWHSLCIADHSPRSQNASLLTDCVRAGRSRVPFGSIT